VVHARQQHPNVVVIPRPVERVDDAREGLIERARAASDLGRARDVDHAVATFRARDADVLAKRAAIVTHAGIL
jgi:hypothetical protein